MKLMMCKFKLYLFCTFNSLVDVVDNFFELFFSQNSLRNSDTVENGDRGPAFANVSHLFPGKKVNSLQHATMQS